MGFTDLDWPIRHGQLTTRKKNVTTRPALGVVAQPRIGLEGDFNAASGGEVPHDVPDGVVHLSARLTDMTGVVVDSPSIQVRVTNAAGLVQNASLEVDVVPAGNVPDCWQRVSFGNNKAVWTTTSDAHSGSLAQRVDMTSYTDGAARLLPTLDSGQCAPAGVTGHSYRVSAWYKSSSTPRWVLFYRNASGAWVNWTQSPVFPSSATAWAQTTWTTPPLPAGATHITFGLSLYGLGFLTVDDFTLFDVNAP